MDRTYFRIDRCDDEHWAVHVDGGSVPVVFTDRAEAVAAALGIARAKWEFAGQPTAVTFPIPGDGGAAPAPPTAGLRYLPATSLTSTYQYSSPS
jgi:hypothetical protein